MAVQFRMEIDREIAPQAFNMDYNRNECQALVDNSEDNLFNLRSSSGVSYFEAICLKGLIFMNFLGTFLDNRDVALSQVATAALTGPSSASSTPSCGATCERRCGT